MRSEFWGQERGLLSLGSEELCAILALVCLALCVGGHGSRCHVALGASGSAHNSS